MVDYLYPPRPAVDNATGELVPNATFQVFDPADVGRLTPIEFKDITGLPRTTLSSTRQSLTETIVVTDLPQIVIKSGTSEVLIESPQALLDATEAALAAAVAAQAAAEAAAISSAQAAADTATLADSAVYFVDGNAPDDTGNAPSSGSGGGGGSVTWGTLDGKPDTFPPSGHTHPRSEISDASTLGRDIMGGTTAQQIRTLIGAGTGNGTSNLVIGTTGTTAAAGNHTHSQYVDSAQAATIADQRIAASGGGSGGGQILVWRYQSGAYPTLPSSAPAGVALVQAIGPIAPSVYPAWVGNGASQVPVSYDYNGGLT